MHVARFWRMRTQRYRLTGVRYENGDVELVNRPKMDDETLFDTVETENELQDETKQPAA